MKRIRIFLAIAALCLVSGGLSVAVGTVPAVAAAAHTTAAVQSVSAGGAVSPDDTACHIYPGSFVIYETNCSDARYYSCNVYNESYLANAPDYVANGCGTRVWIYFSGVRFGYNLCISKNSHTNYLQKEYTYYWVSNNPDTC